MRAEVLRPGIDAADVHAALPGPFVWVVDGHPVVWAAAMATAYLLVVATVVAVVGRPPDAEFFTEHFSYALWFAGIPLAITVLVRGLQRDVQQLAPVLGAGEGEEASLFRAALTATPRALWLGSAAGVLITIPVVSIWLELGPTVHLGMPFVVLRETLVEVGIFAVLGWAVGAAARLSQLTEARARPDLLAPDSLSALARNGTRIAGVWLVIIAVGVPSLISFPDPFASVARAGAIMTLVLICLTAVALIVPCRGAHRVLRSAKQAELETVRAQIAEVRRTRDDARLQGLLAWEARIEAVAEWPINAAVLGRSGILVLLPLASWFASALVERLVDASLD